MEDKTGRLTAGAPTLAHFRKTSDTDDNRPSDIYHLTSYHPQITQQEEDRKQDNKHWNYLMMYAITDLPFIHLMLHTF